MQPIFLVIQILISVILTTIILLQSQGAGLGSVWGGGGESYHTKRGVEKVLLYFTVVTIFFFGVIALVNGIII